PSGMNSTTFAAASAKPPTTRMFTRRGATRSNGARVTISVRANTQQSRAPFRPTTGAGERMPCVADGAASEARVEAARREVVAAGASEVGGLRDGRFRSGELPRPMSGERGGILRLKLPAG